jgi:hypothetical protein
VAKKSAETLCVFVKPDYRSVLTLHQHTHSILDDIVEQRDDIVDIPPMSA